MEHLQWSARPTLRSPVMVTAFTGWNDAGDAASRAAQHLAREWRARRVAVIDPEEFFDFQSTRPQVRLVDGTQRTIEWPRNELWSATTEAGDALILLGAEPQLKWRTFCRQITSVAAQFDASLVLTLGALLADVPHARDVSIIGTATTQDIIDRFGLQRSSYEGPTGIVGVLHDACVKAGLSAASLWAAVPSYAPATPSPKAALALVRRAAGIVGATVGTTTMERDAVAYEREVTASVAGEDDLAAYVRRLEELADSDDDEDAAPMEDAPGSGERLVEDIERFLRDQESE